LPLEDESVDLIVTSPPYFALRSYRDDGEHYDGQLGSEDSPQEFVDNLVDCVREWVRVLKPSGSMFVNLGDKMAGSGGHNNSNIGASKDRAPSRYNKESGGVRAKSRLLLPHRFAIACIDQLGLIVRMDMVWSKPNGLPESVTDRVRASHEYWFHITREPRYFSGVDEIREPTKQTHTPEEYAALLGEAWHDHEDNEHRGNRVATVANNPLGRLPGSVWTVPTEPLLVPDEVREARGLPDHFAAFPQEWPRKLISGWSPIGICTECEQPRVAVTEVLEGETTKRRIVSHAESKRWVAEFRRRVLAWGVTRQDINTATGTSDMYSHWTTKGEQPRIPSPEQWVLIDPLFGESSVMRPVWPDWFLELIYRLEDVPLRQRRPRDADGVEQYSFRQDFNPTQQTISGYKCACPSHRLLPRS
jgi:DNA modification methylase